MECFMGAHNRSTMVGNRLLGHSAGVRKLKIDVTQHRARGGRPTPYPPSHWPSAKEDGVSSEGCLPANDTISTLAPNSR
ncbi:hypothetical protein CEXT_286111 [Caerostris extrusa]|uniref:Uncharacterized protein n=1 Tax=Caerostris extrusa TaxID=172846 RepID=A0AAV4SIR0_CAEEX|nr:hypothetical protein CEXT_286111 [Caerostris extrusa]